MGREIRRVPPNWEHPKRSGRGSEDVYQPLYDEDYPSACKEWKKEYALWISGKHPDYHDDCEFWDWWGTPPDADYYHEPFTEDPTWYQVYETVSEGTPVTPPFATKDELVDYLVERGDFWDQRRGKGGWNRDSATGFVDSGWVPSMMVINTDSRKAVFMSRDLGDMDEL